MHHLFYQRVWINTEAPFHLFASEKGPLYWIPQCYTALGVLFSNSLFLQMLRQVAPHLHPMLSILLLGSLIPWLANLTYLSGISPWNLDLTPFSLGISCLLFFWGLRHQLMQLSPVARSTLFEKLPEGVIITDPLGQIVDLNQAAPLCTGLDQKQSLGKNISTCLTEWMMRRSRVKSLPRF